MYTFVGANQFLARTVGAALKTLWRTSGAANTWIPYWFPMKLGRYVHPMVLQKRYAGIVKILIIRPVAPCGNFRDFEHSAWCNRPSPV